MSRRPARLRPSVRPRAAALLALVPALAACEVVRAGADTESARTDSLVAVARQRLDSLAVRDTQPLAPGFQAKPRGRVIKHPRRDFTPVEDSLSARIVFAPATQQWYLAAVRAKRLLVDIGRVDMDVKKAPARLEAMRAVATAMSPVAPDAQFRLHGPWGVADARVSGYDAWNGRVVAVLALPPALDSLARATAGLVASAELLEERADTTAADSSGGAGDAAAAPTAATTTAAAADATRADTVAVAACVRDSIPLALRVRVDSLRDSVLAVLTTTKAPRLERLAKKLTSHSATAIGCFGGNARVLLAAGIRSGDEFAQERMLLVDERGRATPLVVRDFRFKAHDALRAFDADGDGIDDVAALGVSRAAGGTVVLRLDPSTKRLERLAGGFAWEGM